MLHNKFLYFIIAIFLFCGCGKDLHAAQPKDNNTEQTDQGGNNGQEGDEGGNEGQEGGEGSGNEQEGEGGQDGEGEDEGGNEGNEGGQDNTPQYFNRLNKSLSDYSGKYLIVYEDLAFDGSLSNIDVARNNQLVTITDDKIDASAQNLSICFTISKSGDKYIIQAASGLYIGKDTANNGLDTSDSAMLNSISINSSGDAVISGSAGTSLRFNSASDQKRFRYYKSGQQPIQLYMLGDIPGGGTDSGDEGGEGDEGDEGDSGNEGGEDQGGDGGNNGGNSSRNYLELPAASSSHPKAREYYLRADSQRNYTAFYDTDTYSSLWIAFPMAQSHVGGSRSGSWKPYPEIPTSDQINIWSRSYGVSVDGTIYSRGHQIADGDRSGNSAMQSQTYYAINSTPQIQDDFNGGIWNHLENALRSAIPESDTLYIATGPVYKTVGGNESVQMIQAASDIKQCPVPNYYFKVILKVKRSSGNITSASAIGFWFEHKRNKDSYENYAVSVDEVERKTGFDFFANLPDEIEAVAEKNTSWSNFRSF